MAASAAVAEKPVLHCFASCRSRQPYTRVRGISRPVYSCDGCGNTREIEELGVTPVPRLAPPLAARPKIQEKKKMSTSEEPKKFKKPSPIQDAIAAAVKECRAADLERITNLEKEVKDLQKQIESRGDELTDRDLDRKLNERFEEQLPDLVTRCLLQQLSTPKGPEPVRKTRKAAASASGNECRHKNFMRACESCQNRHAAKGDS